MHNFVFEMLNVICHNIAQRTKYHIPEFHDAIIAPSSDHGAERPIVWSPASIMIRLNNCPIDFRDLEIQKKNNDYVTFSGLGKYTSRPFRNFPRRSNAVHVNLFAAG